jgi:hypothetical protein
VNRHWVWVVVGLYMATVSACGTSTEPSTAEQIEGTWNWIDASGGIAGTTQTPETAGYTQQMRFVGSGTLELYRDGALHASTGYSIVPATTMESEMVTYDQSILGFEMQAVSFDGPDVLFLADGCCDGFSYRFERAP